MLPPSFTILDNSAQKKFVLKAMEIFRERQEAKKGKNEKKMNDFTTAKKLKDKDEKRKLKDEKKQQSK